MYTTVSQNFNFTDEYGFPLTTAPSILYWYVFFFKGHMEAHKDIGFICGFYDYFVSEC